MTTQNFIMHLTVYIVFLPSLTCFANHDWLPSSSFYLWYTVCCIFEFSFIFFFV